MSTDQGSRPAPLFVGDHPALDFLNTVATPSVTPIEWLADGTELLDWLELAELVDKRVIASFRDRGGELDEVADQARTLREWFRGFASRHAGKSCGAAALRELEPLNELLAEDAVYRQVTSPTRRGSSLQPLQWSQQRRWTSPRQLLQPIAEAMGDLVCHGDFHLVRACEGLGCTLMFYDRTKGHGRRWCSMSVCGNRAKAAAHRARLRDGGQDR
ncbi:MAG: CGNR zinc finger domain-containing protein [Nevskia sp.]|nr:CGNR zinc finger domain-containing protein [Nevskia sp.]